MNWVLGDCIGISVVFRASIILPSLVFLLPHFFFSFSSKVFSAVSAYVVIFSMCFLFTAMYNSAASPSTSASGQGLVTASVHLFFSVLQRVNHVTASLREPIHPSTRACTSANTGRTKNIDFVCFACMFVDGNHECTWDARNRCYREIAVSPCQQ